jgi:hypothetical protein
MDGWSRWDIVLWIVVAYVAVMTMVRMMLHHRSVTVRKLRDQLAGQQRRKNAGANDNDQREAA